MRRSPCLFGYWLQVRILNKKDRYYTQREAAAAAGVDPKTLYTWLRNGEVSPSIKVTEKKFLWTEADIEELRLLKRKNASQHNSKASRARKGVGRRLGN